MSKENNLEFRPFNPLPPLAEVNRMCDKLAESRKVLLKRHNVRSGYHVPFSERTAIYEYFDPVGLTLANLEILQSILVNELKHWRIAVQLSNPSSSIVIYSNEICLASSEKDLEAELKRIRGEEAEYFDSQRGVHDRQFRHVNLLLKSIKLPKPPYQPIVVCAYDSYRGNKALVTVWIIIDRRPIRGHATGWLPSDPSDEDGYAGASDEYDVSQASTVMGAYDLKESDFGGFLYCLAYKKERFLNRILLYNPLGNDRCFVSTPVPLSDDAVKLSLSTLEIVPR